MAAKKVLSRVGQRWQRTLVLESLEDRCVPSVSGTLVPVTVAFTGDDREVFARHQQTRTLEENSVVHHHEQPSSSLAHNSSEDPIDGSSKATTGLPSTDDHALTPFPGTPQTAPGTDDGGSAGTTTALPSTDDHAPTLSPGTPQTAGSDDDGSSRVTVSQPSTDDHAPAPSAGTGQTTAGSDDDGRTGATASPPSTDDHAPTPSGSASQTSAGSEDDGHTVATASPPSTDDHAPAPSAGTGQTIVGTGDDGHSGATVSQPSTNDHSPAPAAGTGQASAGSDDRGASAPVSQPLNGDPVQASAHKATGISGSGSAPLAPLGGVSSTSQGTDAGAVKADSSGTGTSTIGSLPASGVDVSRKDGHPGLSVDLPPGVVRPASATPLEGSVVEMSQASAGSNAGEPGKSSTPAEAPFPEVAGLIGEVAPFDLSSVEAAWQNFLGNVHDCANNLTLLSTRGGAGPWIVFAALTTTAFELARRQLKRPSDKLLLFEAADGRSSGLKHPPARPEP